MSTLPPICVDITAYTGAIGAFMFFLWRSGIYFALGVVCSLEGCKYKNGSHFDCGLRVDANLPFVLGTVDELRAISWGEWAPKPWRGVGVSFRCDHSS